MERLFNELAEAPGIIERLPQERREELINKLRRVQLIPASEASQADAFHLSASGSSSGRPETIGIGRPIEVRNCTFYSKDQSQKERETKRNGGGSAMEVDQGDQEGGRSSASTNFMNYLGTPTSTKEFQAETNLWKLVKTAGRVHVQEQWMPLRQDQPYHFPQWDHPRF